MFSHVSNNSVLEWRQDSQSMLWILTNDGIKGKIDYGGAVQQQKSLIVQHVKHEKYWIKRVQEVCRKILVIQ